jgi:hypothetical protein
MYSSFNWNILNRIHYKEAMGHFEKIPELASLYSREDP